MDDALQAASVALVLYGSWEAGSMRMRAYAAKLASSFAQVIVGANHGVWGVLLIGLILSVLQVRGIIIWHKKGVAW